MACILKSPEGQKAWNVVMDKIQPLKLSQEEKEDIAHAALSDVTTKEIGASWSDQLDATRFASVGTFELKEGGIVVPNVKISPETGMAWIRRGDGSRFFLRENPLSFLPPIEQTNMVNWILNELVGSTSSKISKSDLEKLNKEDGMKLIRDLIDSPEVYRKIEDTNGELILGSLLSNEAINTLYDEAMRTLSGYGVKILSQEEANEMDSTSTEERSVGIGSFHDKATENPMARMSDRLKLELARIPELNSEKEEMVNDFFPAMKKYMNPLEVHNLLLRELAGATAYTTQDDNGKIIFHSVTDVMIERIKKLETVHPSLEILVKRLEKSEELRTMVAATYSLSLMDYVYGFQQRIEDSSSSSINIGRTGTKTSVAKKIINEWQKEFTDHATVKDGNETKPVSKAFSGAINTFTKLKMKYSIGESLVGKDIQDLFKGLGVELSSSAAAYIALNSNTSEFDFIQQMNKPMMMLKKFDAKGTFSVVEDGEVYNLFREYWSTFGPIAEMAGKSRPDIYDSSEKGKDSKGYFKFAPTSGIHQVINLLQAGDRSGLEAMKEHPMYKGSMWIEHLTGENLTEEEIEESGKSRDEILIDRANNISPFLINLIKGEYGESADNKELTDTDQIILQINLATQAFEQGNKAAFLTSTPGDKGRAMGFMGAPVIGKWSDTGFKFGFSSEIVKLKDGKFVINEENDAYLDSNSEVQEQFAKYYRAEEGRIAFERSAFAEHAKLVGNEVARLEKISGEEYSPSEYFDVFKRQFSEFKTDFNVIEKYHIGNFFSEARGYVKGEILNSEIISKDDLRGIVEGTAEDSDLLLGLAMTGNAGKFMMFEEVKNSESENLPPSDGDVMKAMARSLANRYADALNTLNGTVIKADKVGEDGDYKLESDYMHVDVAQGLQFWLFNNMIQNVEYNKMFTADLAMYGDAIEYFKRVPATYTDGTYLSLRGESAREQTYNISIIKDIVTPSAYIDNIREALHDEDPSKDQSWLADSYNKTNTADGQAFITPNRWKFIMQRLNKWNNETAELFDAMVNDPYSLTNEEMHEIQTLMKPLKGVGSGINTSGNTPAQKYIKYSQSVIIPAFAKGTDMEHILAKMDKAYDLTTGLYDTGLTFDDNGNLVEHEVYTDAEHAETTHEIMFESAVKVGAYNVTQIHQYDPNDPTKQNLIEDFVLRPQVVENKNWKLQQDLPDNGVHDTLIASQIQQNIKANIVEDGIYKIPGYGDMTGSEILDMLDTIMDHFSYLGNERLKRELGMDEDGEIVNDGQFRKALIEQIKDKASREEIAAIEGGAELESIPSLSGSATTILMSMVNKAAVKHKTNGGSFVQVSGTFTKFSDAQQSQILFFNGKTMKEFESLKPPRKVKSGTVERGQAFLGYSSVAKYFPMNVNEEFEDYRVRFMEEIASGRLNPEIFTAAVGYRIPNQNMSSNDSLEIIGILPPSMGDSIVLYDEIVTKTGSDFDIDKMYIMMNNVKVRYNRESIYSAKKGLYNYVESIIPEGSSVDVFNAYAQNDLGLSLNQAETVFGTPENPMEGDRYKLMRDLIIDAYENGTLLDEQLNESLDEFTEKKIDGYDIPSFISYTNKTRSWTEDYLDEETGEIVTLNRQEITHSTQDSSEAGLGNSLMALYRGILESPHTQADLMSPLDFDWLKDSVNALGLNTPPALEKNLMFTDPIFQVKVKQAYMSGKRGVAQAANQVAHHPQGQEAGLLWATPMSVTNGKSRVGAEIRDGLWDLTKIWEENMDEGDTKGKYLALGKVAIKRLKITQTLSSFLNAYVDIAKDPYVTAGNFNESTFNAAAAMLRSGMQKEVVLAVIASMMDSEVLNSDFVFKISDARKAEREAQASSFEGGMGQDVTDFNEAMFDINEQDDFDIGSADTQGEVESDIDIGSEQELETPKEAYVKGEDDTAYDFEAEGMSLFKFAGFAEGLPNLAILSRNLIWDNVGDYYLSPEQLLLFAKNGKLQGEELINVESGFLMDNAQLYDRIRHSYLYAKRLGSDLTKTMRSHKMSDGVGITISDMTIKVNEQMASRSQENNTMNSISVMRLRNRDGGVTAVDTQWNNTIGFFENMSPIMLQFDPRFQIFLNAFKSKGLQISDKEFGNYVEREAMGSLYFRADFNSREGDYINKLFGKGEDGLALRIQEHNKTSNNLFLQNLNVDTTGDLYSFIRFQEISSNDPRTKDIYMDSFAQIKEFDEGLYKDLISYAVHSKAMKMSIGSYELYIPTEETYARKIDQGFQNVRNDFEGHFNHDLIREIYLNNPKLAELVEPKDMYSVTGNKNDRTWTKMHAALEEAGFEMGKDASKEGKKNVADELPGTNMFTKPEHGSSQAFISVSPFKVKDAMFIKTARWKGRNYLYERIGYYTTEKGFSNAIYALVEPRGITTKKGDTIKEYNMRDTKIETNMYFNAQNSEYDIGEMRVKMADARAAFQQVLDHDNEIPYAELVAERCS